MSPRACALLLLNMIGHDCGVDDKLRKAFNKLNENEIETFYKEAVDTFLKSSEMNNEKEAFEMRRKMLSKLSDSIIEHSGEKLEDPDEFDMTELPTDFQAGMPNLGHIGLVCDLHVDEFPNKGQIASGEVIYPINPVLHKMRNILGHLTR